MANRTNQEYGFIPRVKNAEVGAVVHIQEDKDLIDAVFFFHAPELIVRLDNSDVMAEAIILIDDSVRAVAGIENSDLLHDEYYLYLSSILDVFVRSGTLRNYPSPGELRSFSDSIIDKLIS